MAPVALAATVFDGVGHKGEVVMRRRWHLRLSKLKTGSCSFGGRKNFTGQTVLLPSHILCKMQKQTNSQGSRMETMDAAGHGLYCHLWAARAHSNQRRALIGSWVTPPMTGVIEIKRGGDKNITINHGCGDSDCGGSCNSNGKSDGSGGGGSGGGRGDDSDERQRR
jgi:hypothetical protein